MKVVSKTFSVILLGSILLSACGAVTAVPTVTPTLTATALPTETYIPSLTPTPSPTILPSSTPTSSLPVFKSSNGPEKDISHYKLRPWQEFDYGYILDNVGNINRNEGFDISYYKISDYLTAFQLEKMLMFQNSPEYSNGLWEIQSLKPDIKVVPGINLGNDLLGSLIIDLLGHGVKVGDLEVEMQKHGRYRVDLLSVSNLIGNSKDGTVLSVTVSGVQNRMYVIFSDSKDIYHVVAISDWRETTGVGWGHYYDLYDIGDTNDNGLPEVVIQEQTGFSGIPQYWSEKVSHVEWSSEDQVFSINSYPVFSQSCDEFGDGPCEGDWEFSTADSQRVLITRSYWSTRGGCPDLALQQTSTWDGEKYVQGELNIVPPKNGLSQLCRLAWAEVALSLHEFQGSSLLEPGWMNDLAISIIEHSLEVWPPQADRFFGSASRDYFKLRLGIWHDLRGEEESATLVLGGLANNPHVKKFNFMARMSDLYLQTRGSQGKVKACLNLENTVASEFKKIAVDSNIYSIYDNDKFFMENWGVVDWVGKLCDVDEMLIVAVKESRVISGDTLRNLLRKSGIRAYQDTELDLNADGLEDYLFLMDTSGLDDPDIWAFFASPDGYQAKHFEDFYFYETDSRRMKVLPVQVGDGEPIYLITANEQLIVARLNLNNSPPEILVEEFLGVKNFHIIDNESPVKIILDVDNNWDGKKTNIYQWDSSQKDFILEDDLFMVAQAAIEDMIYDDYAYAEAISYIDLFLTSAPPEPHSFSYCAAGLPGNGCVFEPYWYVPYFRYLQGVAYEKLDQKQQATKAYFNLWKMFPDNIFGVAASLKLEPMNP